jgi:ketosteroid isomerase-like protein
VSRENVELMRRAFEAYNREGPEAIMAFIHPDFETAVPAELSVEPDTYRGREGLRRYFESFYDVMDEVRFEPEELVDAGDRVVVCVRLTTRARTTGLTAEQRVTQVWTLRDGLAVRADVFLTREEALGAVGLPLE